MIIWSAYAHPLTPSQQLLILPHQSLFPQPSLQQAPPLTLQTLPLHQANPYSHQNTDLGMALLQHELKQVGEKGWVMDFSTDNNFREDLVKEWLPNWQVIRGLSLFSSVGQRDHEYYKTGGLEKQLDNAFSLGKPRHSFIGPLNSNAVHTILELGLTSKLFQFAVTHDLPIFLQVELEQFEKVRSGQSSSPTMVLLNPCFNKQEKTSPTGFGISTTLTNFQSLDRTLHSGTLLLFDCFLYSSQFDIRAICALAQTHPQQIILSPGVRFKTHLSKYGGAGFAAPEKWFKHRLPESSYEKLTRTNIIRVLGRKKQELEQHVVKEEVCEVCGKGCKSKEQMFSKKGKWMCSMGCVRMMKG